jgi:kynurenine formamidase
MEESRARRNWKRWGDQDERGALNLLTDEGTLAAARGCRSGKTYSLALPLQRDGVPIVAYRGSPQRLSLMNQADPGQFAAWGGTDAMGANEDVLILPSHSVTHMDALSHVYADGVLFNGFPSAAVRTYDGAPFCGIDKVRAVAGRCVLLDIAGHQRVDWLEPGYTISGSDMQACADSQGVELRSGDIVLIRTGYVEYWMSLGGQDLPFAQPGIGLDAVDFIHQHDFALIGADNSAVEVVPFDDHYMSGHLALLVSMGVPLIEHLMLAELAHDRVHEGLFVVAPLPVTGASGSPVNPVVIA